MTHKKFVKLVKEMREAQTKYFKSKTQSALFYAVRAEAAVDKEIQEFEAGPKLKQGSLL